MSTPAICVSSTDLVQPVSVVLYIQYLSDVLGPHKAHTGASKGDTNST